MSEYEIVKAACGTRSHWTVIYHGEQVACRRTKRDAQSYVNSGMAEIHRVGR